MVLLFGFSCVSVWCFVGFFVCLLVWFGFGWAFFFFLFVCFSDLASPQQVKDFLGRIKFHQNLGHHENLVELLGCCVDQLPLYMIMEDVSFGDLLTFLWTCRKVSQKKP